MDSRDLKILDVLQRNGRITNKKLSEILKLSPPSVLERVRKLEDKKIIKGYKSVLDREKIGRPILAFLSIALERNNKDANSSLLDHLTNLDEVLEVYQVTGRFDFLIKISAGNLQDLDNIISTKVSESPFVKKVETFLVLNSFEEGIYPLLAKGEREEI